MSDYYTRTMICYDAVDKLIGQNISKKEPFSINSIVLEVTRKHPISPKAVRNRIIIWVEENPGILSLEKIDGREIVKVHSE